VVNNDRELVQVPTEVIARVSPSLLIFIYATAAQILRRRTSDPDRGRPLASVEQIEREQELALLACLEYSRELQIRVHQISADDPVGFDAALTRKND
jgi:adenylate kinase